MLTLSSPTDLVGTHSFNKSDLSTSGLITVIVVACGFGMILAVLAGVLRPQGMLLSMHERQAISALTLSEINSENAFMYDMTPEQRASYLRRTIKRRFHTHTHT
jgi:hypothetical protein